MFGFGGVRMFVREMVAAFHEDTRMSSRLHHYLAVPFCCDPSGSTAACEPVPVRRSQGTLHGLLVLNTLKSPTLAIGG